MSISRSRGYVSNHSLPMQGTDLKGDCFRSACHGPCFYMLTLHGLSDWVCAKIELHYVMRLDK